VTWISLTGKVISSLQLARTCSFETETIIKTFAFEENCVSLKLGNQNIFLELLDFKLSNKGNTHFLS